MPPNIDLAWLWRQLRRLFTRMDVKPILVLTSCATLLALYPEEVIRAAIAAAALLALGRGVGR